MSMKILIFGRGQMGQAYHEYFTAKDVETNIAQDVDVRNLDQVNSAINQFKPDVVINCAGKTNLDWCEQNRLECFDVNVLGADVIAEACQVNNIYLVHLSSGCVQESLTESEARKETDPPHPLAFYSWTKVWAENLLTERGGRYGLKVLILRGRQLVSAKASKRNALTKLVTYSKFIDTPNSMTVVEDMLEVTDKLMQKSATGVYNVANPGIMTPYRLALLLKELVKPDMVVEKISKDELNSMTLAKRIDCVLDLDKLSSEGITLEPAEPRLRKLLPEFKMNLENAGDVLAETEKETAQKLSLVNK